MLRQVLIFGFPLLLILIEWVLRRALQIDSQSFMGPSLASVGLGFLLPMTQPREQSNTLHANTQRALDRRDLIVFSRAEWFWIEITWLFIFALLAAWCISLYYSTLSPSTPQQQIVSLVLGSGCYLVSAILTTIRGWRLRALENEATNTENE